MGGGPPQEVEKLNEQEVGAGAEARLRVGVEWVWSTASMPQPLPLLPAPGRGHPEQVAWEERAVKAALLGTQTPGRSSTRLRSEIWHTCWFQRPWGCDLLPEPQHC